MALMHVDFFSNVLGMCMQMDVILSLRANEMSVAIFPYQVSDICRNSVRKDSHGRCATSE